MVLLPKIRKVYRLILLCIAVSSVVVLIRLFNGFGHLHIKVVDAYTLMPLENAAVIIPDVNKSLLSDSSGSCIFTGIPIRKNALQSRLISQNWGECTIISLYEGYRPTVILHAQVEKNIMRNGPTIYMFPEELDDIDIASIVESPNDEWLSQLVEKYSG